MKQFDIITKKEEMKVYLPFIYLVDLINLKTKNMQNSNMPDLNKVI